MSEFLSRMHKAIDIAKQKGAILNADAVLGQAALESGWGRSYLTRKANNLFGIKAFGWTGPTLDLPTTEYVNGQYIHIVARWRVYPSYNLCLVDYSRIIQTARNRDGVYYYRDCLPHADPPDGDGDVVGWVRHLVDHDVPGELGWATGPNYVNKVLHIVAQIRDEWPAMADAEGQEA